VLDWLPYAVAGWILLSGFYGLVTSRHLVHTVICVNIVQSSTYVLLLSVGWTRGGTAPVFADIGWHRAVADPVVQAMTLTDIVVGAAVTALLLALTVQVAKHRGTVDPRALRSPEREQGE
jgi:multicomponent Na+:H+ antiporter subunit C